MNDKPPTAEYMPEFMDGPHGPLAFLSQAGRADRPGLVWLGGYASDMRGTKAEALADFAAVRGLSYLRFDYSGHGESSGAFEDGTIGQWAADATAIIKAQSAGPQILVGSSMGGWIAGLLAQTIPNRIAGMMLIAPAPDFATELTPHQWPADRWAQLQHDGIVHIPSEFDDSVMTYTKALFEDGARYTVLNKPLPFDGPVRILTGMADDVVPWQHAVRYAEHISSKDVRVTMNKNGDHRMSSPDDIAELTHLLDTIYEALP